MQEEVTQKTIALSMKTGKLTAQALQAALKKYLQHRAKGPKLHHGKQSLKQLKAHGAALTNIEVTEANIGAFKPCAKKYGVDFTLRKDKTTQPPHYIVIFKAKDSRRLQTVFSPANTIRLPSLKQARTTAASCRSSSQTALTRTASCWNCYTVLPPRKMQHLPRSHWRGCCAKSLISYQSPAPGNLTVYRKTPVQRILCCLPQKWL